MCASRATRGIFDDSEGSDVETGEEVSDCIAPKLPKWSSGFEVDLRDGETLPKGMELVGAQDRVFREQDDGTMALFLPEVRHEPTAARAPTRAPPLHSCGRASLQVIVASHSWPCVRRPPISSSSSTTSRSGCSTTTPNWPRTPCCSRSAQTRSRCRSSGVGGGCRLPPTRSRSSRTALSPLRGVRCRSLPHLIPSSLISQAGPPRNPTRPP